MRLAIGDVHGRDFWKRYMKEDFSEFYFVGDYFDSYGLTFETEYANFLEISGAARADRRIRLCLGNHDYHYLSGVDERYSRYQRKHSRKICEILEQNMDIINIVYVTPDNYLISHAGISAWFMEQMKKAGYKNVEDINKVFRRNRAAFGFNGDDPHGDDITQSPLWIRPKSLEKQALAGYHHIVGHTPMREIVTARPGDAGQNAVTITYIDTWDRPSIYRF